jgi:hypothetical protein
MRLITARIVLLSLAVTCPPATMLAAQDAPVISTIVVPAVANIRGFNGVQWRTDVGIRNDQANDMEIVLTLAAAPDEPFFMTTLGAGRSLDLVDIVRQTFGMNEMISPLVVQTLGPRSPTVGATIYALRDGSLSSPELVPVVYGRSRASLQSLDDLKVNDSFRTNIGIANLSDSTAEFSLSLQRLEGRSLAIRSMSLPPGSIIQAPIQAIFPVITEGDNFRVLVESSVDDTYCYASVIDNGDHHAVFVQPLVLRVGPR